MKSTTPAARWQALKDRDTSFEGTFFYGVTTTRIFCRPGCASRRPLRQNTVFFDNAVIAAAAGFRPCARCRPDRSPQQTRTDAAVQKARQILDRAADEAISVPATTLESLARECGVSPFHLQRHFKRAYGLSPKAYAIKKRSVRLRSSLRKGGSVLRATYESGFNSPSRAYAAAAKELGMSPSMYRKKGEGAEISYWISETSVGRVIVGATARGICAVLIGKSDKDVLNQLRSEFPQATLRKGGEIGSKMVSDVISMIEKGAAKRISLDVMGTPFQWKVWDALRKIPAGETRTYGEIARAIGTPGSARAVGRACATNRAAIVIPCHRVVRGDGVVGEYRWGSDLKKQLLRKEASD